jgi:predicted Zn-dependent protease
MSPAAIDPARQALQARRDAAVLALAALEAEAAAATDRRIELYVAEGTDAAARRAWARAHRDQFAEAEFADAIARARVALADLEASLSARPPPAGPGRALALAGAAWLLLGLAGWAYTRSR